MDSSPLEPVPASPELFPLFMQHLPGVAFIKDAQGRYTYINETGEKVFRHTREEWWHRTDDDLWPAPIAAALKLNDRQVLAQQQPMQTVETVPLEDGPHFWLVHKFPIPGPTGSPPLLGGVAIDISERHQAAEALKKSQSLMEAVVETVASLVVLTDPEGRLALFNRACEELTGYRRQEVLGQKLTDLFFPPEWVPVVQEHLANPYAPEARRPQETPWVTKSREERLIEWRSTPLPFLQDGRLFILGTGVDITARKRAEEALQRAREELEQRVEKRTAQLRAANERLLREIAERQEALQALQESEERFRVLFQTAGSVIILLSPEGNFLEFNQEAERVSGLRRAEVLGKNAFALFLPEEVRERAEAELAQVLAGKITQGFELPVRLPDGSERLFLWNATLMHGAAAQPEGVLAVGQDITQRKETEEALRNSEQKLRFLTAQLMTAQERERRRLSRELHDELGQALLVLKLQMSAVKDKLRKDQRALGLDCYRALHYIDALIDNVRRLSRDLSPSTLEELGLSLAIRHLLEGFCTHYQIKSCDYVTDEIDELFSPRAQISIYRIFQESLTNIGKHAGASRIVATIKRQDGRVAFTLEDDGKGFRVEEVLARPAPEKGLGLAAMDERLRILGGTFQVLSQPGAGTKIFFTIPIDAGGEP